MTVGTQASGTVADPFKKGKSTVTEPVKKGRKKEPSAEFMTITPAIAADWLEKSWGNRGLRMADVMATARNMATGDFDLNGETIKFDWDGFLRDGHHRLKSCVDSGQPFASLVVFDLDPASIRTVDVGAKRTSGEALAINSERFGLGKAYNHNVLAGVVAWAINWDAGLRGPGKGIKASVPETLDFIKANPLIALAAEYAVVARNQYRSLTPATWGMAWWLCTARGEKPVLPERFFQNIQQGVMLGPDHPALLIRERLREVNEPSRGRGASKKLNKHQILALVILGWNAYVAQQAGMTVPSMTIPRDLANGFPVPIGTE